MTNALGTHRRVFFGGWRLALLASLQIFLSLPFMYWIVTVPFGQTELAAFAGARSAGSAAKARGIART